MRNRTGRLWCVAVAAGALTAAAVPSAYAASAEEAPAPLAGAWTAKLAPGSTAGMGGFSCDSSTASGVDNTILSATWQCQGPLGSTGSAALTRAATFSPSTSSGGIVSGSVDGVVIKVQMDGALGLCTITAAGNAPHAAFNQATSEFSMTPGPGLAVTQATNCAGLANVGDQFPYSGTHRVTFT
ncbi:hypothetical protein ACFCV8_22000 [Streptomyces sp. NPDC056347]|uniref:hypothetical protein n=1 Tax=Streptomyces sp. NPDC056347 TaxID=3345790 RepID=UPI0035D8217E